MDATYLTINLRMDQQLRRRLDDLERILGDGEDDLRQGIRQARNVFIVTRHFDGCIAVIPALPCCGCCGSERGLRGPSAAFLCDGKPDTGEVRTGRVRGSGHAGEGGAERC
jgi:hypothetical protein